ncbi:MAG: hypothetical protein ABFC67_06950 [Mizugakiibacter sp.]|uniref:hypothetical protein n=1 Tax=Mizugakiibacter sp. TaxID=1972610 RepID=UPI0031BF5EDF|nr:hypothetical protein [Xanthomonadaceae bacterium]
MTRIEPTIGTTPAPSDLPPELPPVRKQASKKPSVRRSNQFKMIVSAATLYAIVVGVVAMLLQPQPTVNAGGLAYRLGEVASYFLIAMIIGLGCTLVSKKPWTWGFAVFVLIVFLVPIWFAGTHS